MPVVVEGKYDRLRLGEVVDGAVIETGGFGIFSSPEKLELLRRLAREKGLIILTDSDRAGFKIRHYIRSCISEGTLVDVYIPDIPGKERRKASPSKEGKLGVEGIPVEELKEAFYKAGVLNGGADDECSETKPEPITKADLYILGLSGTNGASEKRARLLKKLSLPERLTAKGLLPVINALYTREEFYLLAKE